MAGGGGDDEIVAEQEAFYRADAAPFDDWLSTLADPTNDSEQARTYRDGKARLADHLASRAPLGTLLEVAAGTGRLASTYLPHADRAVLLDTSADSLAIAARHVLPEAQERGVAVELVEGDAFTWTPTNPQRQFDTIVFSSWLHHVPQTRFAAFWDHLATLLDDDGEVVFDVVDGDRPLPGRTEIPDEPADGYVMYAPVDGVSVRDHFGVRWRVVHVVWKLDDLLARLADLGWEGRVIGPGMFGNVVWLGAHRRHERS